jgi:phospholipase C
MKAVSRYLFLFLTCVLFLTGGLAFAQFPPQIKNVVVIVQENRTPDNLFHFLTPVCPIPARATGYAACMPAPVTNSCYDISPCGLSNQSGKVVPVTLAGVNLNSTVDPVHSHSGFEDMCDPDSTFHCRNDGAWRIAPKGASYAYVLNPAVTNYDGSQGHLLDPYLSFAEQYGWANFMYQTNQGPSYPAHQFLFSGTSALTDSDDANSIFVAELFQNTDEAGCLLPASTGSLPIYSQLIQPTDPTATAACEHYNNGSVQECRLDNTIGANNIGTFCSNHSNMATTVLDPHAISWKYYAPWVGSIWAAPNAIQSICEPQPNKDGNLECTGSEFAANVDVAHYGTDILRDVTNCSLSRVSWVIPDGAWSDHADEDNLYGPSWVAAVINAIGTNPTCPAGTADAGENFWEDTAIVVTWDDWGGWSDNEPANQLAGLPCVFGKPCPADYQMGFRVPLLVLSAYTPKGYIDNDPHDFGSILRMIEGINHLPEGTMGNADARSSTDLHEFFDPFVHRPYQVVPAVKDASFFLTYSGPLKAPDND